MADGASPRLMGLLAELALARGGETLRARPGAYEVAAGRFRFWINGHAATVAVEILGTTVAVPPREAAVVAEDLGLFLGFVSPRGHVLAAAGAAEDIHEALLRECGELGA